MCSREAAPSRAEGHLGAAQLGPFGERRRRPARAPRPAARRARRRSRAPPTRPRAAVPGSRPGSPRARAMARASVFASPAPATTRSSRSRNRMRRAPCCSRSASGVVRERRRVVHLEVRAELRRSRDGPVALREPVEVVGCEPVRRRHGGLEPLLRRALEIGGERAVLQRQREPGRRRRHAAQDAQQADEERALHFRGRADHQLDGGALAGLHLDLAGDGGQTLAPGRQPVAARRHVADLEVAGRAHHGEVRASARRRSCRSSIRGSSSTCAPRRRAGT